MIVPRPTALGYKALAFHAVLVVAFFAAPYSNLLFLLLAFLTVLGLFSVVWTVRNVSRLHGRMAETAPVPAGVPAPWDIALEADGRERYAMQLTVVFETGRTSTAAAALCNDRGLSGCLEALPRGVYGIRRVRLGSVWPLGLWRAEVEVRAPQELVVHPAPRDPGEAGHGGAGEDERAAAAAAGAMQPAGLREFRPGDEPRRVHWRSSARRSTLVIQEWEGGRGAGYEILLDRRCDAETLERHLSTVAALALRAKEEKEGLTLHTQGLATTFDSIQGGFDDLWRFLAAADCLPADGAPPPPAPPEARVLRQEAQECS